MAGMAETARDARVEALTSAGAVVYAGDLADPNSIARAAEGCQVIFHCASESSHRASRRALSWINVAGTENVISAARHAEVGRVVMLSCADVSLSTGDRINWNENVALGRAPFGELARSKLLAEELAMHASDDGLTVTAVRPALLWGPGERNLLPTLCAEARTGGVRLMGSGSNLLATTHVENAVDGLVAAAQADQVAGQAFHVADADNHTAREFFELLCGALGVKPPRRGIYTLSFAAAWLRRLRGVEGPWPTDVIRRGRGTLLDCLRAHSQLDFTPSTSVEEGMQELAQWVAATGGPAAIEKLARGAAGEREAEHYRQVAEALEK